MSPQVKAKKRPTARRRTSRPAIDGDAARHVAMTLARRDPGIWFETFGRIIAKSGEVHQPRMNVLQRRVLEAWKYCEEHGIPCRIIVLKPRQKGSSTWSTALAYWLVQSTPDVVRARIIGGKYKQVKNLWDMLEGYAQRDECLWPGGRLRVLDDRAEGVGGSEVTKETALDEDAGRSGTFRVVIATELGRWKQRGVAAAAKVLNGLLACVPREAGTLVLLESTAQGVGGEFHSRYWKAVPLSAFKAGRRGSGYIRVFAAWFEFDDSRLPLTKTEARALLADLDADEREIMDRYGLDLEQMAWRRATIADECDGDVDKFKQEYPSNEREAFLASGRPRFDAAGLETQSALAEVASDAMEDGDIALEPGGRAAWRPAGDGDPVFRRWEEPQHGRSYLLACDLAEGAAQTVGEDPDFHSVGVLRAGYFEAETGAWVPPALVARIIPPRRDYKFGCRWDYDLLEDAVWRLAQYFGNCRIAPEMNKDLGLVEALKRRGSKQGEPRARIYEREVWNEREKRRTKQLAWKTTPANREAIVGTLARAIRRTGEDGEGVEVRCEHAIAECTHFEHGEGGRSEAAAGWHDDDVLMLSIGLTCIGSATLYSRETLRREDPADVRLLNRRARRPGGRGQYG